MLGSGPTAHEIFVECWLWLLVCGVDVRKFKYVFVFTLFEMFSFLDIRGVLKGVLVLFMAFSVVSASVMGVSVSGLRGVAGSMGVALVWLGRGIEQGADIYNGCVYVVGSLDERPSVARICGSSILVVNLDVQGSVDHIVNVGPKVYVSGATSDGRMFIAVLDGSNLNPIGLVLIGARNLIIHSTYMAFVGDEIFLAGASLTRTLATLVVMLDLDLSVRWARLLQSFYVKGVATLNRSIYVGGYVGGGLFQDASQHPPKITLASISISGEVVRAAYVGDGYLSDVRGGSDMILLVAQTPPNGYVLEVRPSLEAGSKIVFVDVAPWKADIVEGEIYVTATLHNNSLIVAHIDSMGRPREALLLKSSLIWASDIHCLRDGGGFTHIFLAGMAFSQVTLEKTRIGTASTEEVETTGTMVSMGDVDLKVERRGLSYSPIKPRLGGAAVIEITNIGRNMLVSTPQPRRNEWVSVAAATATLIVLMATLVVLEKKRRQHRTAEQTATTNP